MLSPSDYERLRADVNAIAIDVRAGRADKSTYVALRDRLRDAESELTAAGEIFHTRTYCDGR